MVQPGARDDESRARQRARPRLDDDDDVDDQDGLHRPGLQSCSSHSRSNSDSARAAYTSSPLRSPASSLVLTNGGYSPLARQLSRSTDDGQASRASRHDLARRLSQLAHQLTYGGAETDDDEQHPVASAVPSPSASLDRPTRSDLGSVLGSPDSSLFRTRFSDLSASLHRDREAETREPPPEVGMTAEQATKVIAEMAKLNDELSAVVGNLKARQEESDVSISFCLVARPFTDNATLLQHIHGLLIERAERAAQRIMFLQNRIAYLCVDTSPTPRTACACPVRRPPCMPSAVPPSLTSSTHREQELEENDDELQHLRICLKAVEIQMPPHPDRELQRCIATFKHDYQALKKKRAGRASLGRFDSASASSPTRTR